MTLLRVRSTLSLCFRSSLRQFALASTAALIALMLVGAARADTIEKFFVDGTAANFGSFFGFRPAECPDTGDICPFSGTMVVDVTAGSITTWDITFPGVESFNNCCSQQVPVGGNMFFAASSNNANDFLNLEFSTTPTPASLVDFDGGSITGERVGITGLQEAYAIRGGEITPVPEPSSLALLGCWRAGIHTRATTQADVKCLVRTDRSRRLSL